jgi:hypothetical protein
MELKKSNRAARDPWYEHVSPVAPLAEIGTDQINTSTPDVDLDDAWELKSKFQCARDECGPLNSLRWLLWDRCRIGNPPSRFETRPNSDDFKVLNIAATQSVPHLLKVSTGRHHGIRSVS